jgi:hypothetical protein
LVLRPTATHKELQKLARAILDLVKDDKSEQPPIRINEAQVCEAVWTNSQCVMAQRDRCPLLIFSKQLAGELNEFFHGGMDEGLGRRSGVVRTGENHEEIE